MSQPTYNMSQHTFNMSQPTESDVFQDVREQIPPVFQVMLNPLHHRVENLK